VSDTIDCNSRRSSSDPLLDDRPLLKAHHQIIGITDDIQVALCDFLASGLGTQIKDVVQIRIGEQWRNHRTLRSTHFRLRPLAIFRYSRPQPFLE
jgi:hypothetical protein